MDCPYCGTANPVQARFCLGCGRPLVAGMVCATCHTLLPAQARYCFHCGAVVIALGIACPQCGTVTAAGQAQCGVCGAPLGRPAPRPAPAPGPAAPSPVPETAPAAPAAVQAGADGARLRLPAPRPLQDMLPSLCRYLHQALCEPLERRPTPQNLADAGRHLAAVLHTAKTYLPRPVILAPQPPGIPAGGLYQGTFLFADVSGFTPLSERLSRFGRRGAERITAIINDLFRDLVSILFAHGGSLLKFGGDALLGLFDGTAGGALRAVQAALAMQAAMERFSAIEAAGETRALRVKCGISSGVYFAAHLGTPRSMAYVTTGHTVNRADEAESHAQPGEVVIAQATHDLLSGAVEVEPRAEGFYRVCGAPQAESLPGLPGLDEPPPGPVDAQISYLVERLDRLSPYLAAELLPRIVTNPVDARIAPDHRPVTVMFANYVGVSDLIDDVGETRPELITRYLNDYFVHMAEVVERYEGALARMDQYSVGDRLVVFFGAPRAHEDDPVRAVHTALAMQEATRRHFAALQLPEGIYRFRQRIGINTGFLFAGNAGAPDLRQEYTLMGDDINMAARLMSRAEWGEILISNKTHERVSAFFEVRDRGQLKVKGKETPIPTFQVTGERQEVGPVRGIGGRETPLADRHDELLALRRCGEALLAGRGQIVAVVGDSGLGKTRLARELKRRLFGGGESEASEGLVWLDGHALSFSEQVSYWLAAHVLHAALGLGPNSTADDTLYALWERGEDLLGKTTAREAIPFLAHLLDLPLTGEWERWVKELDPKVRQKQTFWAVREFLAGMARRRPLVIALDDLHWADEASLSLLEDALQVTDRAPLLFCLVFRERRDKGCWRLRDRAAAGFPHRYTEVALQPLADAFGRELLDHMLPGHDLPPERVQDILDKAAGNPFYLEEVIRSLQDSGAVAPDAARPGAWRASAALDAIRVPDTLQGAILARIDRLTEDARQALQMAAVIGRRFQVEALRSLAGAEAEMELWLAQLERTGLIRPVGAAAEPAYTFPDALVQEVAYDSLLVQRRQEFHRRVGETLEALLGDRVEQECEVLAYHFVNSDDSARAIRYLDMAGRKAQAGFANETAVRHYTALLERLAAGPEDNWQRRFDVLARRQQVLCLLGRQKERQADLETMSAMAAAHGDEARCSDALNGLADLNQWTGRYAEAEEAASQALAVKSALGDRAGQAEALHQIGVVQYIRGAYDAARPALERAVALRSESGDAEGEAWSLMYLGMIHLTRGEYPQAAALHERAFEMAQARQDWFQVGIHLTNAARVSLRLGQYDKAQDQIERSLEMKRRVGDRTGQGFSLYILGLVHTYRCRYDVAVAAFQASLDLRRQIDDRRGVCASQYGLGLAALGQGQFGQAAGLFETACADAQRLGLKADAILALSHQGLALAGLGDLDRAAEASGQAIALLAEQRSVEEVQQVYLNHFRVLAARREPAAGQYLRHAFQAMMDQADRIADPACRQIFLEQVRVNREIAAEIGAGRWETAG